MTQFHLVDNDSRTGHNLDSVVCNGKYEWPGMILGEAESRLR